MFIMVGYLFAKDNDNDIKYMMMMIIVLKLNNNHDACLCKNKELNICSRIEAYVFSENFFSRFSTQQQQREKKSVLQFIIRL